MASSRREAADALAGPVEAAERLIPVLCEAAGRFAASAVTVIRQRHAARAAAVLARLREQAEALRRDPADEAVTILKASETRLRRKLPVPRIEWPKDDLLSAPVVRQP